MFRPIRYDTHSQPCYREEVNWKRTGNGSSSRWGHKKNVAQTGTTTSLSRFSLSFNLCLYVVYRKLSQVERQPMPTFKPPTQWYCTSKAHRDNDIQSGICCTFRRHAGSAQQTRAINQASSHTHSVTHIHTRTHMQACAGPPAPSRT